MGIFSFLGKKDRREDEVTVTGVDAPRRRHDDQGARSDNAARAERLANSQIVQRDVARKTALKIDAIESEMSSELARPACAQRSAGNTRPMRRASEGGARIAADNSNTVPATENFSATLPVMGMATDFLLGAEAVLTNSSPPPSETPAVIEEVAILFANDQNDLVESMLLDAINDKTLGAAAVTAWWMLFDLYQISGNQAAFDTLALSYASKFETSPPTWMTLSGSDAAAVNAMALSPDANNVVVFTGKLDATIQKQLDRAHKLAVSNGTLRFECARVTEATVDGCILLLAGIRSLQQAGCVITLAGGNELLKSIRGILEVGRRDDSEAPWLLLLDTLQLMNRQQDFEEASIDYCVTYEVSPPAFIAPVSSVTAAVDEHFAPSTPDNVFMMPAVVDGKSELVTTILNFVRQYPHAILDCSHLARVDFSAASQLLGGLAPLAQDDRTVELHNVNHLVHALFNVMGLREVANIFPRKH